jgi:hypothetical protein
MRKLFKEVLPLYEQHLTAIYSVSTPSECMRTWLRSREGHGEPARSPYERDTPFFLPDGLHEQLVHQVSFPA